MSKSPVKSLPPSAPALIARMAGITVRHLNRLARDGCVPKAKRGQYDTEAAITALIKYFASGREGSSVIATEKLAHLKASRVEIEQRTASRARELIPFSEARSAFDTAMVLLGSQLEGMGGRLANELAGTSDPATCRKVIFDETRRIRAATAAELESVKHSALGGTTSAPAAGNDSG